jgi:hypothetical protein
MANEAKGLTKRTWFFIGLAVGVILNYLNMYFTLH